MAYTSSGYTSWIIYPPSGPPLPGSFGYLAQARKKAKEIADKTGGAVMITRPAGQKRSTKWVYPSKRRQNPARVLVPLKLLSKIYKAGRAGKRVSLAVKV